MKDITYGADVSISDTSSTLFAGSQEAQRESLLVLELVLNLGERVSFRERCFSTSWAQDDNWAILSVDMIWRQEGCSFLDYLI